LLVNPWSIAGLGISLSERRQKVPSISDIAGLDAEAVCAFIETSTWYSMKLRDSFEGYKNLRDQSDKIQAYFCQTDISATILLTEKIGFFEPYLDVNILNRHRMALQTFELTFEPASHLYGESEAYWSMLLENSLPLKSDVDAQMKTLRQSFYDRWEHLRALLMAEPI
jgi:hypothetical protein